MSDQELATTSVIRKKRMLQVNK